jgi:Carbohydrate esterase, sialic acid-specific acetylesterase
MHVRKLEITILAVLVASCIGGAQSPNSSREKPVEGRDLQLFLLIGQSNMAGRGEIEPSDRETIPQVFMLNREMAWAPAVDPLHFDKPAIAGVGLGRAFAKSLAAANPSVTIGLVPAAFGGSSLEQWKPSGQLYQNALERIRLATKAGTLRGVLWHQGESDSQAKELATSYPKRFSEFIERLREDLGAPNVPVIVGQLGEFYRAPFADLIRDQLASLPTTVPHCAFVSSAGLAHKGDQVHFDSPSVREFGRRYAAAFLRLTPSWTSLQ